MSLHQIPPASRLITLIGFVKGYWIYFIVLLIFMFVLPYYAKISIQSPDTFPTTARTGFLVSPGRQYDVAITGFAQTAHSDIESIPLDKRICTLDDELKLTYFSGYTSDYCMLDCLATLLLRRCHCVLYFFPCNISASIFQH